MPYSNVEIKGFAGLYLQANSFSVPDGALEDGENIIISKDNKISKTRGNYQYFDPSSDTLNNLFVYQDKIIAAMSDKLRYFTDTGTAPNLTGSATTLTGATVSITAPRVSRSVLSNNNLYFTTDNGPLKLEAYNGSVFQAGAPPGLDLRGVFSPVNGVIGNDTSVAYRLIFGRRDANDNLILGAPSDILVLTNAPVTLAPWSRVANVVTVTSSNHGLSAGMSVDISTSASGTPDVVTGAYTITAVTTSTFSFAETAADSTGTLTWAATRGVRLEYSIPSDITSTTEGYFVQIYRSSQTASATASPSSDFKLVDELKLTAAQITARVGFYDDEIDDLLLGAELYTNPNSREGELQANYRPPLCEDMTLYKGMVIYGNCTTRHLLDISVLDSTSMANGDFVEIKIGGTTRRYVARTGVGNSTVSAESVSGTGTVTITYTSHGLVNGDTVYISNVTGTVPEGSYVVSGVAANTFDITSPGNSATALDFEGVTDGTYNIFQLDIASLSIAVQLRRTAQGLVRAINRDASSLVYASYSSLITDIPGKIRLIAKGFGDAIYLRANTTTAGEAFSPVFPDSFASGDQVYSRNESQPHTFYASKVNEPEAVPIVNNNPTGSRNKDLLRVVALRDSMIVLKEDGVFRVTGDTPTSLSITILDNTVFCVAPSSVQVLNNQVIFLSNQGVCLVTESSVQIISRKIEDVIQPIVGLDEISTETSGIAYESERVYLLTTIRPNETVAGVTYIYNVLNDSWTTTTTLFKQGLVGPNDIMYMISTGNRVLKERKDHTKIDYCGQNTPITVTSVIDGDTAVISSTTVPQHGDIIIKGDVLNRVSTATSAGGTSYLIEFERAHNLSAADSLQLYESYQSRIKLAPFHAGAVGRMKQFSQVQIHMRDNSISELEIAFTGYTFGGSESVTWIGDEVLSEGGWGSQPWGFFGWGQQELLNLTYNTTNAPVIRVYVPKFQQRDTFIQPILTHTQAGEPLSIQAIAFALRGYAERVSK